jgi:tRNA-2-methylthio-N6-dimethylallyladenosine synthase
MISAAEAGQRLANVEFIENESMFSLYPQAEEGGASSRFVTIMQGCDNYCTYCIVPYVRGKEVSRPEPEIISEITRMAQKGVREVTLLGQNVNSYGAKSTAHCDFPELLRKVALIDGIERIRFTTSHPKDLSPSLIRCFAEMPKLCGHIHLPAQSGSDRVLARMERGYTRSEYLERISALKSARPDIQITGDMIVGFPGETEDDFSQTLSLMEEVEYADLFSFIFSARPETKAAGFEDQLAYREKQQRLSRLQFRQKQVTLARNRSFVGTVQQVLVEGLSKRGDQLFGRTDGNRIVNFTGEMSLVGGFVSVLLTKAYQNSFLGELIQE